MKKFVPILLLSVLLIQSCLEEQKSGSADQEKSMVLDTAALFETGMKVSMSTFGVLSGELQKAMKAGGVSNAVPYCNLNALPIADSLSEEFGVVIRRVTDRPRNPADTLNEVEAVIFGEYSDMMASEQQPAPKVVGVEEGAYYFAPIMLQEFCQKCHGTPGEHISEEDYALISNLYPEDRAINYRPGELRGMWSIYYPENKVPYIGENGSSSK